MALHNILIPAHPTSVWEVLADAYSYDEWVMGTKQIVHADSDWPAIGSAFNYEAGFGPVRFRGHTVVRDCDGGSRLEMEADANLLSARVAIGIKPWGDHSLVVVEEHWIRGPYLLLDNPLIDLALNIRNRLMVRRLAEVVQGRSLPNHGCR